MEKIRVSKVEDVTLWRHGIRVEGTLHLTAHHIIFTYTVPTPPVQATTGDQTSKKREKELWITYPMINSCIYRPAPPASHQAPSIRLRGRDFTFIALHFLTESKARDVYDSIRSLSCKIGRIEKLYAFNYKPQPPENKVNGWELYDAEKEFRRLGIGGKNPDRGWRVSHVNANYTYSPTYPSVLVVPSSISDNVLTYAGKYRSRARIPALSYRHPVNNCSITRSSQPLGGFARNRSVQDERLVAAIFATTSDGDNSSSQESDDVSMTFSPESSGELVVPKEGMSDAERIEDDALREADNPDTGPKIYGAQQRNLIVDARPTVNAIAMQAVGKGSENMDYYKNAAKAYLGIDNIHVMRRSLNKVIAALKDTDMTPLSPNRELLAKSGWLQHITNLLDGSALIARQVGIQHSHALIHCSDGWDRTSQLSALSQICLDPYYRTIDGFIVLVEKDWLSFGHMFRYRAGLLGSDKWFEIENERIAVSREESNGPAAGGVKALENAFLKAQGFFKQKNTSRESVSVDSEGEMQPFESSSDANRARAGSNGGTSTEVKATKVDEISPIFHQFLEAAYQLLYQHPTRFEFNERFLRRLLYHLYSCQYGTFLFDNERERAEGHAKERTRSVWDYFVSRREQFTNPKYDSVVDDNQRGRERLLFPRLKEIRWWAELYGRKDEEMNGPLHAEVPSSPPNGVMTPPVLHKVETAEGVTEVPKTQHNRQVNPTPSASEFAAGLAHLDISESGTTSTSRSRSPR